MNPQWLPEGRDSTKYQSGIGDTLKDLLKSYWDAGISPLSPNNPIHNLPPIESKQDLISLLEDPNSVLDAMPMIDPGMMGMGAIRAFHGSPHKFMEWDFSKMGSGEGVQAYGHGGYFAGGKGTGEWYKDQLTAKSEPKYKGKPIWDEIDLRQKR